MSDPIRIQLQHSHNSEGLYAEITDALAAEIVRRGSNAVPWPDPLPIAKSDLEQAVRDIHAREQLRIINGPPTSTEPSASHDEDSVDLETEARATIRGIIFKRFMAMTTDEMRVQMSYDIVRSIRRREVPGIIMLSVCNPLIAENKELRASLQAMATQSAQYMKERDELHAKLAEAQQQPMLLSRAQELRERSIISERDKALAELDTMTDERNGYANENLFLKKERDAARAEAEALRAEVFALKADADRFRWLLDGNGYFMEEASLCGHAPCSEDEKNKARKEIDEMMALYPTEKRTGVEVA